MQLSYSALEDELGLKRAYIFAYDLEVGSVWNVDRSIDVLIESLWRCMHV
jgi:hypothetical protein